jgi:N-acetyl-gamma-glutamyl-phosphate reductase
MAPKVYIDGHVGTTGLRIRDWLADRNDLDLITPAEHDRKDAAVRRECIRAADLAVLCLPNEAAEEAAAWAQECGTKVIDASTAHRVASGWVYGLPELEAGQRAAIRAASRVSNPGCYASAFVLLARPLVDAGLIDAGTALTIHALSGYSGGGRALIEKWEQGDLRSLPFEAPYSLTSVHKHVPEMMQYTGLRSEPCFIPAVGPFRCGMRVELPLPAEVLRRGHGAAGVWEALQARYANELFVRVRPHPLGTLDEFSFDPRACNDTNYIDLAVVGHPSGHVLAIAVLDNLGKGAAGVAIQNLNLMLGVEETRGL